MSKNTSMVTISTIKVSIHVLLLVYSYLYWTFAHLFDCSYYNSFAVINWAFWSGPKSCLWYCKLATVYLILMCSRAFPAKIFSHRNSSCSLPYSGGLFHVILNTTRDLFIHFFSLLLAKVLECFELYPDNHTFYDLIPIFPKVYYFLLL